MGESKFKENWETIANTQRMTIYQQRATLKEIGKIGQDHMPDDDKLTRIMSIVKASGVWLDEKS